MQNSVRYYIVKTDDQPVVRSVPVSRPRVSAGAAHASQERAEEQRRKPSVSSLLRLALRRKQDAEPRI